MLASATRRLARSRSRSRRRSGWLSHMNRRRARSRSTPVLSYRVRAPSRCRRAARSAPVRRGRRLGRGGGGSASGVQAAACSHKDDGPPASPRRATRARGRPAAARLPPRRRARRAATPRSKAWRIGQPRARDARCAGEATPSSATTRLRPSALARISRASARWTKLSALSPGRELGEAERGGDDAERLLARADHPALGLELAPQRLDDAGAPRETARRETTARIPRRRSAPSCRAPWRRRSAFRRRTSADDRPRHGRTCR